MENEICFNPRTAHALAKAAEELGWAAHDIESCISDNDYWQGRDPACFDRLLDEDVLDVREWCNCVDEIIRQIPDYFEFPCGCKTEVKILVDLALSKALIGVSHQRPR